MLLLMLLLLGACSATSGGVAWRGKFGDSVGVNSGCGYFRNGTGTDGAAVPHGLCVVRCAGRPCLEARAACDASSRCSGITINGEGTLATLKTRHRWADALGEGAARPAWFRQDECSALLAAGASLAHEPRGAPALKRRRQKLQEQWRGAMCDAYTRGPLVAPFAPPTAARGGVEADLVFDVGYNAGLDTALFLRMGMRVRAVEADAATIDRTARRHPLIAAALADDERRAAAGRGRRLAVIHGAVAEEAGGTITFYAPTGQPQMASIHKEACRASGATGCVEKVVPTVSCAALVLEHGTPLLLKVDIEGADLLCIASLRSLLAERRPLPTYVAIEDNSALSLLLELGYTAFKLVAGREINQCDADDAGGGHSLVTNSIGGLPAACTSLISGSSAGWSTADEVRAHRCFDHKDPECPADLYARRPL